MEGETTMHITTIHPAANTDLDLVAAAVANARAAGDDSGRALFDLFSDRDDQPEFSTQSFRAGNLCGEWVAARGTGSAGVMLYLHGRFQHHEPAGVLAGRLSAVSGLPVLLPHYRLAPNHPYPAALDDTLAAYHFLLDLGIPADHIVIVGHSAGATLVLSALIALRDSGRPMPACAAAISPITDFTLGSASLRHDDGRDVVTLAEVTAVRDAYLGSADPARAPQSPLAGDCTGLPPLLIGCGGAELLRDDATRFSKRAAAGGAEVDVEVYAGMPHGFPVMPTEAASAALERIAAFSARHLASSPSDPTIRPLTIRRIG
jgi:acetyl esterase/lipase